MVKTVGCCSSFGGVIDVWLAVSNSEPKFVAIDEQTDHGIVQLF